MSRIVLHIDRLVLRGIDPNDADAFAVALQEELRDQLKHPDTASRLDHSHRSRLHVGAAAVERTDTPTMAQAIAGKIAGGITL